MNKNRHTSAIEELSASEGVFTTAQAERLGIPFYDRALCEEAAKRSGLDPTFLELAERREGRKLAYQFQFPGAPFRLSLDD